MEGVELSTAAKKKLESIKEDQDNFICRDDEEGFKFSSNITVVEAKKKRKRKR